MSLFDVKTRRVKAEQDFAEVELKFKDRRIKLKALVDTGASRSLVSKRLADYLGASTPLEKPYELRTADRCGRLKVVGYCNVVVFGESRCRAALGSR